MKSEEDTKIADECHMCDFFWQNFPNNGEEECDGCICACPNFYNTEDD